MSIPEKPPRQPGLSQPQRFGPSNELTEWFAAMLRGGRPISAACAFVGMSQQTFRKWLILGETAIEKARTSTSGVPVEDRPYVTFLLAVGKARSEFQGKLIDRAVESDDPRERMFLLERMFPADFGRREAVELTGAGGGPIEVAPAREQIEQRIADAFARMERPKLIDVSHDENEAAAQ